jgi:site-specific recombinase XerD
MVENAGVDAVNGFIDELTRERKNSASTRNLRLTAIQGFFRWLAMVEPQHLATCSRALCIPKANTKSNEVLYLEREEIEALFAAIDRGVRQGRRNYALLALMYNTGARVQEVLDLKICDVRIERPSLVKLVGKGDKERICVLWPETIEWIKEICRDRGLGPDSTQYLFVNRHGQKMTRHGVRFILRKAGEKALASRPSLKDKPLHPHIFRHTAAMHMLQAGLDLTTIQSILGHSSSETTNRYAKADLAMKKAALDKCEPLTQSPRPPAWKTNPEIMAFLESL